MSWQLNMCLTILLIILGFCFKKSKLIFILQIIWAWLLMAGNCGGFDYKIHLRLYSSALNDIQIFSNAWLYKLIALPFLKANLDFTIFNAFISTIGLFIIALLIKRSTKNIAFVMSLFLIFPFADAIIQKRNFIASAIYLVGISSLLKDCKNKTNQFTYFLTTFIAAQIHPSYYFYYLLYPFINLDDKKFKKIISIILCIAFILIPFIPSISALLLKNYSIHSKIDLYFQQLKIPFYQSVCWWGVHLIFVVIFNSILSQNNELKKENEKLIKINNRYNISTLLFMPLYYYEPTFFRFFRNTLLINYINTSISIDDKYKMTKNKLYTNLLIIVFVILVFLSQFVFFGQGFNKLVVPLLQNNIFIGV